jgi:hypothetical protein
MKPKTIALAGITLIVLVLLFIGFLAKQDTDGLATTDAIAARDMGWVEIFEKPVEIKFDGKRTGMCNVGFQFMKSGPIFIAHANRTTLLASQKTPDKWQVGDEIRIVSFPATTVEGHQTITYHAVDWRLQQK